MDFPHLGEHAVDVPDQRGRAGGEIDVDRAARRAVQDSIGAQRHRFHFARARQRGEDDLASPRHLFGRLRPRGALVEMRLRALSPDVRDHHRVAGLQNVQRHWPAHVAEPDESDPHGDLQFVV